MTCCPDSTHVSILIYMLELEKKSSETVTFTLLNKCSADIFTRIISSLPAIIIQHILGLVINRLDCFCFIIFRAQINWMHVIFHSVMCG